MDRARRHTQTLNAARQAVQFWTRERDDHLRRCATDGYSYSDIATEIGDGCTRNMVAGRADRLSVKINGWQRHRRKTIERRINKLKARLDALGGPTQAEAHVCGVSRETSEATA